MNIIDLFSGAGGLTEGFIKNSFNVIAHVEKDSNACRTLETRMAYQVLKEKNMTSIYIDYINKKIDRESFINSAVDLGMNSEEIICAEINKETIPNVFEKINSFKKNSEIFGIIGGPPCQAYSTIGRSRNSSKKDKDERIYLYKLYIEFLVEYNPEFFLFENVKGLLSFKDQFNENLLEKIVSDFRKIGYNVVFETINASEYGVPQSRERLFIYGSKSKVNFFERLSLKKENPITLDRLFSDLPSLRAGEVNNEYLITLANTKELTKLEIKNKEWNTLTYHEARPHNENDLLIYKIVSEAKQRNINLKYNELPSELKTHKNDTSFLDRYKSLIRDSVSHTIVAHISKDGHYYIHFDTEQNRSITVREAARIQTFPDDYFFESSRTSAFRQIGNAVPPLLSKKIAETIKELYTE